MGDFWFYQGKKITTIEQLPSSAIGIIYEIENLTNNRKYIGRKILYSNRRTKIAQKNKHLYGKKKYTIISKESDWLIYNGSSTDLLLDIKKGDKIKKTILRICYSKAEMTYWESKEIFCSGALESDKYYNKWVKCTAVRQYKI